MLISNSFGLTVNAKNFLSIDTSEDLSEIDAIKDNSILILGACTNAVSYTHLTLPTILRV